MPGGDRWTRVVMSCRTGTDTDACEIRRCVLLEITQINGSGQDAGADAVLSPTYASDDGDLRSFSSVYSSRVSPLHACQCHARFTFTLMDVW
jgi:hypothetical protein